MTWTTNVPTVPGWYWHRASWKPNGKELIRVCAIANVNGNLIVYGLNPSPFLLANASGEWLGPITPHDYQAGRVAGLREAATLGQEQVPHHTECALKWARRCEERAAEIEQKENV